MMLRIWALFWTIIGSVLLLISTVTHLHAQARFPLPTELSVQSEKPLIEAYGYFANDDKGTTWLVTAGLVWSFSVDSMKWTQWPSITLEDVEVGLGYDKAADRFLFWNGGVGKVFTWKPGDPTVQRIDRSFHHRTQFGHAWFIHPETSEIYAFGGYGFWQSRGYTARFDQMTKEWQVLPLDASKPYPSARAGSQYTYDEKRNQFHIFGGHDFRNEGREDLSVDFVDFADYWVLDVDQREWRQYPIYGYDDIFDLNKELRRVEESFYYGVSDYQNDLAWYPARSTEGSYDIRLLVFDYERSFGTFTPISLGDLGIKSNVYWYSFDEKNNQLLIYWIEAVSAGNDREVRVSALTLPHPDSTRAMMDLIREHGSLDPPTRASSDWTWLLLMLPLLLLGGWTWHRRRSNNELPQINAIDDDPIHPTEITFCYLGTPTIRINGSAVRNQLSDMELGLLFWLYWKHRKGEAYQITDDIESIFWHDSRNMDYIRKQRNTTVRRLNEQLADIFKDYAPNHEWIVDRTSISDKRKREYALDLNGFTVNCDLDELSNDFDVPRSILESSTGLWVDQIRSDYVSSHERS